MKSGAVIIGFIVIALGAFLLGLMIGGLMWEVLL